jgi:DNA-directed RNA polymerase subunit RPC12/RpoP
MALIKCSECGSEVSDETAACPDCGVAIVASAAPTTPPDAISVPVAVAPATAPKTGGRPIVALLALVVGIVVGLGSGNPAAALAKGEMPALSINVDLLAQYSVALAVLVNVLGFVIAGYHYSRRGVSPTLIPFKLMWSAGFSFLLVTAFYVHVGYASLRLMHSTVPAEANWYLGLGILFTATLRRYFLTRVGSMVYFIPCMMVGVAWEKGWIEVRPVPQVTEHFFQLPLPAVALVFGFGLVLAYARLVYPVLLRSVGGGAYQPVVITVSDEYSAFLPQGSCVYEVLTTGDSLYLAVETIKVHDKPLPWFSGPYTWRNWHLLESTRYVQLPRSAAKCVEYTDPMEVARPVGGITPNVMETKQPSPEPRSAHPRDEPHATTGPAPTA